MVWTVCGIECHLLHLHEQRGLSSAAVSPGQPDHQSCTNLRIGGRHPHSSESVAVGQQHYRTAAADSVGDVQYPTSLPVVQVGGCGGTVVPSRGV